MTDCFKCKYWRVVGDFMKANYCFKTNPATNLSQMYPVMTFLESVGCKSFEGKDEPV
jgi:hypothetical protein